MVYKRFITKNGKKHGPYYYETYRGKDGKTHSRYLPNYKPKRAVTRKINKNISSHKHVLIVILFFSIIAIIVAVSFLNYQANYNEHAREGDVSFLDVVTNRVYGFFTGYVTEEEAGSDEGGEEAAPQETVEEAPDPPQETSEEPAQEDSPTEEQVVEEESIYEETQEASEEEVSEEVHEGGSEGEASEPVEEQNETEDEGEVTNETDGDTSIYYNETNGTEVSAGVVNSSEHFKYNETNETEIVVGENASSGTSQDSVTVRVNETNYSMNQTNVTEINETNSSVLLGNVTNETLVTNATNVSAQVSVKQFGAVLGKPVKWEKTVKVHVEGGQKVSGVQIDVPDLATNISVTKQTNETVEEVASVVKDSLEEVGDNFLFTFFLSIFRSMTGRVVENVEETSEDVLVEVTQEVQNDDEIIVSYETPAPYSLEEDVVNGKIVNIVGPDEVHYEDVLAFTSLSEELDVLYPEKIKIYWEEEKSYIIPENVADLDRNGVYDYVEWIVPHLSNQTFRIIVITTAEHLDANRSFISDIYTEVKDLDDVWSETINDSHFVRIVFEKNLSSTRDIRFFSKVISGTPRIDLYEGNGTQKIAQYDVVLHNEYSILSLENLSGLQDTFDAQIVGGEVIFDHIIDPSACASGSCYFDDTYILEDIEVQDTGTFTLRGVQIKWNLSDLCDENPTSVDTAKMQFYQTSKTGSMDTDLRTWYIRDQTWGESSSAATINSQSKYNQTDTSFTSLSTFVYVNVSDVTTMLFEACERGEDNMTVRIEDVDRLLASVDAVSDASTYYIGFTGFVNAYVIWSSDEAKGASNRPSLYVTYTAAAPNEAPQWFDNSSNDTRAQSMGLHSVNWTDDSALSGYFFAFDNGTGTFTNDSFVAMSGTQNWSNVTKVINHTVPSTIQWRVYANDSNDEWNLTDTFSYTVTTNPPTHDAPSITPYDVASVNQNLTCMNQSSADSDGHSVTTSYNWLVNDTSIAVLYMPFDVNVSEACGVVKDYSSRGLNGTLAMCDSGFEPEWVDGIIGGGYKGDGSSGTKAINLSDPSDVDLDNFTIMAWVKLNGSSASDHTLVKKDNQFLLRIPANRQPIGYYWHGSADNVQSVTPVLSDEWAHVAYVVNVTGHSMYINGTFDIYEAEAGTASHSANELTLMNRDGGANEPLNGTLDEVYIINRSLTPEQIKAYYDSTKNGWSNYSLVVSQETEIGENWTCQATPHDGFADGTTKENSTFIILGTPTHTTPIFDRGAHYITTDVVCLNQSTSDPDNDPVANVYHWLVNATPYAVMHMPFDVEYSATTVDGLKDYSGYFHNGTLGGGSASNVPTWTSNAKRGGGYAFDGSNDYINLSDGMLNNPSPVTITGWIYPNGENANDVSGDEQVIVDLRGDYKIVLHWVEADDSSNPQSLRFFIVDTGAGTDNVYSSDNSVIEDTWTFFTAVYTGSEVKVYVNGKLNATASADTADTQADYSKLGKDYSAVNRFWFNGTLEDVRLYNRTLSDEQIYQLYLETNSPYFNATMVTEELSAADNWTCQVTPIDLTNEGETTQNWTFINGCIQVGASTTLSADSNACYEFNESSGTLDCDNYAISIDGDVYAIQSSSKTGVTVQNCTISSSRRGISFFDTNDSVISNVTLLSLGDYSFGDAFSAGILLYSSVRNNITSSNVTNVSAQSQASVGSSSENAYGVFMNASDNTTIVGSTFDVLNDSDAYSIFVNDSSYVTIYNNDFFEGYNGILYRGSSEYGNVSLNTFTSYFNVSLYFDDPARYSDIIANTFLYGKNAGIYLDAIGGTMNDNALKHMKSSANSLGAITITSSGTSLQEFDNNTVFNVTYDGTDSAAMYIGHKVISYDNNISSANKGYFFGAFSDFSMLHNGFIEGVSGYDASFDTSSNNVSFFNMTFDHGSLDFEAAGPELYVFYNLRARTVDPNSDPLESATVDIRNATGLGVVEKSLATDASGFTDWVSVMSFEQDSSGATNHTPHNLSGSKTGYLTNSTNFSLLSSFTAELTLVTPYIQAYAPVTPIFSINEPNDQTFSIVYVNATPVTIKWFVNGTEQAGSENSSQFVWSGNYSQAGTYGVKVNISNDVGMDEQEWVMRVIDTPPIIHFDVLYPTTNINVSQNSFFNVSLNVTCTNAPCDPINTSLYYNFSSPYILVNATSGATPFYTNSSTNPLNSSSLSINESTLVTFWVNATGTVGDSYEFFSTANLTTNLSISNMTSMWNITIDTPEIAIAIDLSPALAAQIVWNLTTLPAVNQSADGNDAEEYYVNVSVVGGTADLYVSANDDLKTEGGDVLGLGNETFVNKTNAAAWPAGTSGRRSLSTGYLMIGQNLNDGDVVYVRFYLSAPSGQPAGVYNNTLLFKAVANGESP